MRAVQISIGILPYIVCEHIYGNYAKGKLFEIILQDFSELTGRVETEDVCCIKIAVWNKSSEKYFYNHFSCFSAGNVLTYKSGANIFRIDPSRAPKIQASIFCSLLSYNK